MKEEDAAALNVRRLRDQARARNAGRGIAAAGLDTQSSRGASEQSTASTGESVTATPANLAAAGAIDANSASKDYPADIDQPNIVASS